MSESIAPPVHVLCNVKIGKHRKGVQVKVLFWQEKMMMMIKVLEISHRSMRCPSPASIMHVLIFYLFVCHCICKILQCLHLFAFTYVFHHTLKCQLPQTNLCLCLLNLENDKLKNIEHTRESGYNISTRLLASCGQQHVFRVVFRSLDLVHCTARMVLLIISVSNYLFLGTILSHHRSQTHQDCGHDRSSLV